MFVSMWRTRTWYTDCKDVYTAQRSCPAFRGKAAASIDMAAHISSNVFRNVSVDEYVVVVFLSIEIILVVDKVQFADVGYASYTVTDTPSTTNVGMRCSSD